MFYMHKNFLGPNFSSSFVIMNEQQFDLAGSQQNDATAQLPPSMETPTCIFLDRNRNMLNPVLTNRADQILIQPDGQIIMDFTSTSNETINKENIPENEQAILNFETIEASEDNSLIDILRSWGLFNEMYKILKAKKITIECLKYMKERHIDELFGTEDLGLKIIFQNKLGIWQNKCGIYNLRNSCQASTLSMNSSIESWIQNMVESPSTSKRDIANISVLEILNTNEQGKYLTKKSILTPDDRTVLVHKIIQYYIENDILLTVAKCKQLSEEIVRIFPSENKNTYFMARGRQAPKGKLWDRYQGRKRSVKKLALSSQKSPNLNQIIEEELQNINSSADTTDNLTEEEFQEVCDILKHLRKWDEVIPKWKKTVAFRTKKLKNSQDNNLIEILREWPLYKYSQAQELIQIDFNYMYQGKEFSFLLWEKFCNSTINLFNERIKDKYCKGLLQEFCQRKDKLSTDNINVLVLQLLHSILVPSVTVINGRRMKFTIKDAQNAFTLPIFQENEVDTILTEKRRLCAANNTTVQPLIIVIGAIFEYSKFYVCIDDMKFKFNSYLEALDYCFKIHFVLNLKYSPECNSVWVFIQKFFFNINTEEKHPIIDTLISDLRRLL